MSSLVIERRFRGPANSGNGGYTCGLVAGLLGAEAAEVTLRVPPPLETPLRVEREDGLVRVLDGQRLVAEARPVELALDLPEPVSFAEAERLAGASPPDPDHPFPGCFTCGPARAPGDGLCLTPTAVGDGRVVAPWRPAAPSREQVWAALDCPGAFAVNPSFERGVTVLGRLAASVAEVPAEGEKLVVVAWALPGGDERRSFAGTSLFRGTTPLAWAKATWFAVGDEFRDQVLSGA